jgi:cell division protein FtsW
LKRADRSLLTNWRFQIDWWIFGLVIAFASIGILSGIHSVSLLDKIILFYAAAAAIFLFVPMTPRRAIIVLSWAILAACLMLFAITYASPRVLNESRRWAYVFGYSFMPADLLKPAFIVLTAWFLAKCKRMAPDDWIADKKLWLGGWWPAYLAAFVPILACMFFHPDLGNMFMYIMVFGGMMFWLGMKWRYVAAFGGVGLAAAAAALIHPHYRSRMLGDMDRWQIESSLAAIKNGGLTGRGEESFLFGRVPMWRNDFVFSGLAEMWGCVFAAALLAAMFWMFCLLFRRANQAKDDFSALVIFGAAMLFALHVIMNVATALGLFMKGTTLPFISYGGSSLIGFSVLFAIVLSLIRQDKWGQAGARG